jgi:predicted aspartyl protease
MGDAWVEQGLQTPLMMLFKTLTPIDTGATYTAIPWSVHEKPNLLIISKKVIEAAKGFAELD